MCKKLPPQFLTGKAEDHARLLDILGGVKTITDYYIPTTDVFDAMERMFNDPIAGRRKVNFEVYTDPNVNSPGYALPISNDKKFKEKIPWMTKVKE